MLEHEHRLSMFPLFNQYYVVPSLHCTPIAHGSLRQLEVFNIKGKVLSYKV